jgi:hypothetical protein
MILLLADAFLNADYLLFQAFLNKYCCTSLPSFYLIILSRVEGSPTFPSNLEFTILFTYELFTKSVLRSSDGSPLMMTPNLLVNVSN